MARYNLGELIWKITGDDAGINKSLDQTDKRVASTGKGFLQAGNIIKTAFVAALGIGGKKLISLASDAEETGNKFAVTFGSIQDEADKTAKNLAKNYGLSSLESKKLLSDTGDLLTGFGFTQEASLDLSNEVNKLAVDLASFTNFSGGAEGASQALTKALLGERESVKSLGISILEADVKAKVLENTQKGLTFESERQAKAYATLQIAQEQSKNAIGDFARSEASFANQTRIASANIEDQGVALGQALLPYANLAVTAFNDLSDSTGGLIEGFTEWTQEAGTVSVIANSLGVAVGVLSSAFGVVKTFVNAFKDSLGSLGPEFKDLADALDDTEGGFDVLTTAIGIVLPVGKVLGSVIGSIVRSLLNLVKIAVEAGQTLGSFFGILRGQKGSMEDFKRNLSESKDAMLDLKDSVVDGFVDVGTELGEAAAEVVLNFKGISTTFGDMSDDIEESAKKSAENVVKTTTDAITKVGKIETKEEKERRERKEKAAKEEEERKKKEAADAAKAAEDAKNAAIKAAKEAKAAFESLTPGGLILFSIMGADKEKLTQEIADSYNYLIDFAKDSYNQIQDITGNYFSNELAHIDRNLTEYETAIDTQLALKISQLDRAALGEEAYNAKVDALTKEAENQKLIAKTIQARKSYEIEKKQFKAQQAFSIAEIYINTGIAVMKAFSQLGPVGGLIALPFIEGLAGLQIAQVLTQEPPPRPSFANGGIVPQLPGVPATGDRQQVNVNPGELILNEAQQSNLVNKMNSSINITVITPDKRTLYKGFYDATKRREILIDAGAVVK